MNTEIKIKKVILHILDINSNMFIPSNEELELTGDLVDYFEKHIIKIIDDTSTKKATFTSNNSKILLLCKELNSENFIPNTVEMAKELFNFMQSNVDIPSADLIFCLFEENGHRHLGILKLNYKTGFTHWVENSNNGNVNTIIRHNALLPQEGQKIDECIFINLSDFSIRILEKQYEINGEKEFYLSKYYLECDTELSTNSKLKIIDKVAKEINKKYFDEDIEKVIKLKKAVSESLRENESVQIQEIAEKVYEKNIEARNIYVEEVQKAGLIEETVIVPEKLIEKKFKIQKIKTDTGIEINFPLEYSDKQDKIEFVNNPDGTISIIIKNIGKILNRG